MDDFDHASDIENSIARSRLQRQLDPCTALPNRNRFVRTRHAENPFPRNVAARFRVAASASNARSGVSKF